MNKFFKLIYFLEINTMFIFVKPLGHATYFNLKTLTNNFVYHLINFKVFFSLRDIVIIIYVIILNLIKVFYLPIAIIFFFSKYRFCQLNFTQIGIINLHISYMVKKNLIEGKKTIIFIPKETNFFFIKNIFKNLIIIDSKILYLLALPLRSFSFISVLNKKIDPLLNNNFEYSYTEKLHKINSDFKKLKKNKVFQLNKKYLIDMKNIMKNMNLNLNFSKTLVIHVREKEPKLSNLRGDNLKKYLKTIKYLISENYNVIRITNNYSKKLTFNKNYFELNIDKKFNKELQYFIIHKSLGLISSQSGPAAISTILSRPILELNMNNSYPHGVDKKSLFLLKKIKIKKNVVNFQKLLKMKYYKGKCIAHSQFKKKKIEIIQNSENEIFQATKEFIKTINSKKQKMTIHQKKFKKSLPLDLEMKYFDSNLSNAYIKMNKNLF